MAPVAAPDGIVEEGLGEALGFAGAVRAAEGRVVAQRKRGEGLRLAGCHHAQVLAPVPRPHGDELLAPRADREPDRQSLYRAMVRRVRAAHQEDVARGLVVREVRLVQRRGQPGLAGELVRLHQGHLLGAELRFRHRGGVVWRGHAVGGLGHHDEHLASVAFKADRPLGGQSGQVGQAHGASSGDPASQDCWRRAGQSTGNSDASPSRSSSNAAARR